MTPPGIYSKIAEKIRRALRNKTGCNFTHEEVVAILRSPVWMVLAELEQKELLAQYAPDEGEDQLG